MHGNSRPQHAFTNASLPEGGSESGYANMPVTKVPGWHGMIAWDALLNGMAMGLFLAAAVSELAAPAIFTPVAKVAYPVALVLLLIDLGLLVLDLGDWLRFHPMLRGFQASFAHVGGDVVPDDLLTPADRGGGAQPAGRNGEGLRMGSHTRGSPGTAACLLLRGLQGRLAQHERATRLERRSLDGRLSHQFGPPDGLRRAASPVRPHGANAGDRHPPHRLYRAAPAQFDSLRVVICEPSAGPCATLYPRATMARWGAHHCRDADPF